MENYKVKVSSEAESKEVQELFFDLGFGWRGMSPRNSTFTPTLLENYFILTWGKTKDMQMTGVFDNSDTLSKHKELTIQQLRDLVVLNRNDVNDATHIRGDGKVYFHAKGKDYYYQFSNDGEWLLSTWMNYQLIPQLKPIQKPQDETEYLMQGANGERLMESVTQLNESKDANAWDVQVGGNHYKDMKIQPAQFAMENNLDYLQGNAIKYICRHKSKNGLQDLEKAKHYIDLMIEHFYK